MSDTAIDCILCGRVITLDAASTVAEAVAIGGERIVATGSRSEILALRRPGTRVADTGGVIIPGFNDTHGHMDTEGLRHRFPSLGRVRSIGDVLTRIAALARTTPRGEWIVTMPVGDAPFYFGGPAVLAEKRVPNRHELDRVAPDHPVCILPPSAYWSLAPCYTALNSLGLARNGIDRNRVPRVTGIDIERDANGEPTGVIVEHNYPDSAQVDLLPAVPRFSPADRREALRRSMQAYHAVGTTSVYEGHGCAPAVLDAYRDQWEAGDITMRMGLCISPAWTSPSDAHRQMRDCMSYARGRGFGDAMLRISGVFISYGGEPTAAGVAQANPTDLGWSCYLKQANEPDAFAELCTLAARHDLRVHTIVIDKLHEIVPILQRIDANIGIRHRRWVLEHMSVAREADLASLKALGVIVTLIPDYHVWKVGTRFFDLSEEEIELVSPVLQLARLGVPVAAGTDNSPYNPLATIRAMRTRKERTMGRVLGANARVPAELALRAMTVNGAWLTFEEGTKGALVPGNYADLAVLNGDPITTEPDELEGLTCLATMVGGRFVHGDMT